MHESQTEHCITHTNTDNAVYFSLGISQKLELTLSSTDILLYAPGLLRSG
jgi:hypothetical protein